MNFCRPISTTLSCALLLQPAFAAPAGPPLASEAERAAFLAFHPVQPGEAPVFQTLAGADGAARKGAFIDSKPRRALRTLCRMNRATFTHEGAWRAGPVQQFAWQDGAACVFSVNAIALAQRMPDTDILALIEQQGAILKRARLLFAGNTACAPQRAYNYQLAAIDVSTFINGSEEMAALSFRSDRGPVAQVWVRRSGLAYDPWNVRCQ